jgi:hypothetical protein
MLDFISGGIMRQTGQIKACGKCGEQVLVERMVNGSDHDIGIHVFHWKCLTLQEQKKTIEKYKLSISEKLV